MRLVVLVGVVMLCFGVYILAHGLSYPSEKSVLKMGEFEATMEQQRNVPVWVGGLLTAAGVAVIWAGARRRGDGG
jgi:hypothetical protein